MDVAENQALLRSVYRSSMDICYSRYTVTRNRFQYKAATSTNTPTGVSRMTVTVTPPAAGPAAPDITLRASGALRGRHRIRHSPDVPGVDGEDEQHGNQICYAPGARKRDTRRDTRTTGRDSRCDGKRNGKRNSTESHIEIYKYIFVYIRRSYQE